MDSDDRATELALIKDVGELFLWRGPDIKVYSGERHESNSSQMTWTQDSTATMPKPLSFVSTCKESAYYDDKFMATRIKDKVRFVEKFVQWEKPIPLSKMDLLYASPIVGENSEDYHQMKTTRCMTFSNRLYYHLYSPMCRKCFDENTPLFVVLNGAPVHMYQTASLCATIGQYFDCLSVDCISRLYHSRYYGMDDYVNKDESKRLDILNGEYRGAEFVHEIQAVAHLIVGHLEANTRKRGDIATRDIVIVTNLYTSYYATVLSGSEILRKYNSNVTCFYLSNSALPFKESATIVDEAVDIFCSSSESILSYGKDELTKVTRDFLELLAREDGQKRSNKIMETSNEDEPTDGSDEDVNSALVPTPKRSLVSATSSYEMSSHYLGNYGVSEKACYLVSKCRSLDSFEQVFMDIERQHKSIPVLVANNFSKVFNTSRQLAIAIGLENEVPEDDTLERTFKKAAFISFDTNPPEIPEDPDNRYTFYSSWINFVPKHVGFKQAMLYPLEVLCILLTYVDMYQGTRHYSSFLKRHIKHVTESDGHRM
jgi:hypothetical protein